MKEVICDLTGEKFLVPESRDELKSYFGIDMRESPLVQANVKAVEEAGVDIYPMLTCPITEAYAQLGSMVISMDKANVMGVKIHCARARYAWTADTRMVWCAELDTYLLREGFFDSLDDKGRVWMDHDTQAKYKAWFSRNVILVGSKAYLIGTWTEKVQTDNEDDTYVFCSDIQQYRPRYIGGEAVGVYVENIGEYWSRAGADLAYIEDLGAWVTDQYACEHYFVHNDGCWYSYEEENYGDRDEDSGLYEYSEKAPDYFSFVTDKGKTSTSAIPGELYYGIELELEVESYSDRPNVASIAYDHEFLPCSDGSLCSETGLELKSPPLGFTVLRDRLTRLYENDKFRNVLSVSSQCGIHLHVSRSALTSLQVGLIQAFIYNPDNEAFLDIVCRRRANGFCSRSEIKGVTSGLNGRTRTVNGKRLPNKQHTASGHYAALNTDPSRTIELRMFASSNHLQGTLSALEFTDALVSYTRDCNRKHSIAQHISYTNFVEFVKARGKRYPNLIDLMIKGSYLPARKPRKIEAA